MFRHLWRHLLMLNGRSTVHVLTAEVHCTAPRRVVSRRTLLVRCSRLFVFRSVAKYGQRSLSHLPTYFHTGKPTKPTLYTTAGNTVSRFPAFLFFVNFQLENSDSSLSFFVASKDDFFSYSEM